MEKLAKLNRHHIEQFAYFVGRLAETPDGDGSLLDHMMMLYGCGISDGNQHLHVNLPIVLVGGAAGRMRGGRHVRVADETPLTNLQLSLLDKVGVPDREARRQHRPVEAPVGRVGVCAVERRGLLEGWLGGERSRRRRSPG